MARYVGFKIGKVHEEYVFSEYYCGGCGFPVTDHDSFCPECGGAFRESDADNDENDELRGLARDLYNRLNGIDEHCGECRSNCDYDAWNFGDPKCIYAKRMRELGIEVES